jgi:hypothetical protein
MSEYGCTIERRRDGGLQITIDLQAAPWPYDPLGWAAMLPGVEERINTALAGHEPSLTLCFQRSQPRRTVDLLIEVTPAAVRVCDPHAGVEHCLQLAAGPDTSPRRRFRALAGVVHALALLDGGRLNVTACHRLAPGRGSEGMAPLKEGESVRRRPTLAAPAGRYPRRPHRARVRANAGPAPGTRLGTLEADESRMGAFVATPNRVSTPRP